MALTLKVGNNMPCLLTYASKDAVDSRPSHGTKFCECNGLEAAPNLPRRLEFSSARSIWPKCLTSLEVCRHSLRMRLFSRRKVTKSMGFTLPRSFEMPWQNSVIVTRPSPSSKMSKRIPQRPCHQQFAKWWCVKHTWHEILITIYK